MLRRTAALGSCLAALLVVGCQDQATAPAISRGISPARSVSASAPSTFDATRIADLQHGNLLARDINPDDYPSCSDATPVSNWWLAEALRVLHAEPALFIPMINLGADLVPTYEAIIFESSATPQYFGYNGEHTHTMVKAERDVKAFWDIPSANIEVVAMHGTVLKDLQKTTDTYDVVGPLFGVNTHEDAVIAANILRTSLLASKTMNGGNHPFFTFNSVAFPGIDGWIPPKIVMGDGILAAYDAIGFGDVAPQAIFAHEFGHQIQFANGYFDDAIIAGLSGAEQTRYTELMADAFSAYYLTHKRGAAMNQKRVAQFLEAFFNIGDCAFDNDGHHGTPAQRMASAQFGFEIANQAQKQGHILSAEAFHALFVAKYPAIIAPEPR